MPHLMDAPRQLRFRPLGSWGFEAEQVRSEPGRLFGVEGQLRMYAAKYQSS
jgi:hypothetical protein